MSCKEIESAIKNIGVFPVVLSVGSSVSGHRYFVHRESDIKNQAADALSASPSGRVVVKKLQLSG